ncbi:MAG: hypothetical protein WC141_02090 [Arcobacteraceae bacterium]
MKLKLNFKSITLFLVMISCTTTLFSYDVLITNKDIKYKEKITKENVVVSEVNTLNRNCVPLSLNELENDDFIATHYIFKDSVLCLSDVKKYDKKSVVFDFGTLEIEQEGKVIYENNHYIRLKKQDGTIEKIYKNGKTE